MDWSAYDPRSRAEEKKCMAGSATYEALDTPNGGVIGDSMLLYRLMCQHQ